MLIPIGKEYRIVGDTYQWTVEVRKVAEKGKNKGKEYWVGETYHSTLQYAILALAMKRVRTAPAQTVEEAVKAVVKIAEEFESALLAPVGALGASVARLLEKPATTTPTPKTKAPKTTQKARRKKS